MPNHVTNELLAPAEVIAALTGATAAVDFGVIVPMPEVLRHEPSMLANSWAEVVMGLAKWTPPAMSPSEAFKRGDYATASTTIQISHNVRMIQHGPFLKDRPDDFAAFVRCCKSIIETGFVSWCEWSVAKWGTKWNAYQVKPVSDTSVRFQTAWSPPMRLIEALSNRFPEAEIRIRWADEDRNSNCGDVTVKNGEIVGGDRAEDNSPEAIALALDLLGPEPENEENEEKKA